MVVLSMKTDTQAETQKFDPIFKTLKGHVVTKEYTDELGEEKWLYKNLVIKGHICGIAAKGGFGKTAILYGLVAPEISKKGFDVLYFDIDSVTTDHKRMQVIAEESGMMWINPNTAPGQSVDRIRELLEGWSTSDADLSNKVLFFDTMKKFNDMMSKKDTKGFYELLRKLCGRGATCVLAGHTNKEMVDGKYQFEGVGDVFNDTDELILLNAILEQDVLYVTTLVNPDENAKVRGYFKPISFSINRKTREVTQCLNVYQIGATKEEINGPDNDAIRECIYKCIKDSIGQGPLNLNDLSKSVIDHLPGTGSNKVKVVCNKHILQAGVRPDATAFFAVFKNNRRAYCMSDISLYESSKNMEELKAFDQRGEE